MRRMLVKKLLAMLCAVAISISCIVNSVGAVDTTDAEIEYSLMYLDKVLPKDGNMGKYKDLDQYNNLNRQRSEKVKHENGTEERIDIDEKIVYDQIKATVNKLMEKVDERTPGHPNYKGNPTKNFNKPRDWRIAKAIYRWAAKNLKYDWESGKKDSNGNSLRKPQDALFVFATRQCVCLGRTDLIKVMMRMAGIPCAAVETIPSSEGTANHIYNAVYLDNPNDNRKGWALLDVPNSSLGNSYQRTDKQKRIIKERFPAFYRNDLSVKDANRIMITKKDHKIRSICFQMNGDNNRLFDYLAYYPIAYYLDGVEKNAYIKVFNGTLHPIPYKNLQIPDDMLKLGLKFKIGNGIESIILKGNETLDVSEATDLKSVDVSHSDKYDRYDALNKKLVYKKKYIDKLTKKLNDKINNEFNPTFTEHRSFINSIGINLNSSQDSTAEARKKAFDFVDGIYNNSVELTGENLNRANDLLDEAIKQMKTFKKITLLDYKIQNEYNPIFNEHCSFINSIGIGLNSPQDSTAEARKAVFDFVDGIYNNSVELTDENLNRANSLINEAIRQMKTFKKDTLVTILNKKRKQFEKRVVKHKTFRNSLNCNYFDFTLQYRQNAINFYNIIYSNVTEANVKQAVGLFDLAIKQMDKFKFKYMNNNFMNNNFMNNNHFNNNFMNNFNNNFMNNNFMNNNFMNNNFMNNNNNFMNLGIAWA